MYKEEVMQVTVNFMVKFCISIFHFLALFLNNDHFTIELFIHDLRTFPYNTYLSIIFVFSSSSFNFLSGRYIKNMQMTTN